MEMYYLENKKVVVGNVGNCNIWLIIFIRSLSESPISNAMYGSGIKYNGVAKRKQDGDS